MPGYAKIPDFIRDQIARCDSDTFYVGRARNFTTTDLENGRWSKYNVDGRPYVRKDLPKIEKVIGGWQTPNFGDWSKGSHTHYSTRKVFKREIWYAQRLPILIDVQDPVDGQVTIGFRVDRVFDRADLDERDLRLVLSLLRENVNSHASLIPTALSVADWLADQRITWEILPRGEATFEKVVARLNANPSNPRVREMQDRYTAVDNLRPGAVVVATVSSRATSGSSSGTTSSRSRIWTTATPST